MTLDDFEDQLPFDANIDLIRVFQVICDLFNSSINLFRPIQWLHQLFEACSVPNTNNI
jgi:hypothetical protein